MSKIITIPTNIEEIHEIKNIVDGFIIGIKDMCVNCNYSIDDLSILSDICDKEIFISINKNMNNDDLYKAKEILLELNNYSIKGIIVYDIGVLNIYNSLNLNYDIVIAQEHSLTNASTVNFWNKYGAKYAYLSSDITVDEINNIKNNSEPKIMVNLFGYLPMFVSKRHIVDNYLDKFKLKDSSKVNYMEKEGKIYPIIDNNIGTQVYSNNILNGIKYALNGFDYIVINSFNIEKEKYLDVLSLFKTVNKNNISEYNDKINDMFTNIDYGFLERKTIYKVTHEK